MAKLIIPERCCICNGLLQEGDRIIMERSATLTVGRKRDYFWEDSRRKLRWIPSLQPQITPTSPKKVRHKECNDGV